jgi:hypothetical protein
VTKKRGRKKGGLSRKHHGLLHAGEFQCRASPEDWAQLRAKYPATDRAQRQIDIYGGSAEYARRLRLLVRALRSGDADAAESLQRWFEEKGYTEL